MNRGRPTKEPVEVTESRKRLRAAGKSLRVADRHAQTAIPEGLSVREDWDGGFRQCQDALKRAEEMRK